MERYNGVELDPEGAFVYYDDAQRALDAEREKVKEYMTNYVPLKALEDVEAQLAQLQALVRWLPKVEIIDTAEFGPMCVAKNHFQPLTATVAEGGAYLALAELLRYRASLDPAPEENASLTAKLATLQAQAKQLGRTLADVYQQRDGLQAQLRQVEGERAKWEDIAGLRFAGDHKFVKEMELLKVENTTLRQLVEALPVVDGRMDVECGACYYIRSFIAGQYGVVCGLITEQSTAMAIKALLEYRATQAAQDAGAKLPAWVNEAMRLAPTQTNPPHPTEERS